MTANRKRGGARPRHRPRGACPVCGDTVAGVTRRGQVELSPHGPVFARCSGTGARVARLPSPS